MNSDQANPTEDNTNAQGPRPDDVDLDATRMISGDTASDKGGAFANPDFRVGRMLGKYEVTELLGVGDLQPSGGYSVADATRMTIEACKGLAAAHKKGLVHRDVKPVNLLLTEEGAVKVSDFGLVKRTSSETMQMTQAGQIPARPT